MRPLIAAEPMLRAPRPEMVLESTLMSALGCVLGALAGVTVCRRLSAAGRAVAVGVGCAPGPAAWPGSGLVKRRSSIAAFASIRSHAYCALLDDGLPLPPIANAWASHTPLT